MSNQRPGKTYRATATDDRLGQDATRFFQFVLKAAQAHDMTDVEILAENVLADLRDGKPLPTDGREIERVMGL